MPLTQITHTHTHTTSQHTHIKPQNGFVQAKDTSPGFIHHLAAEFKGQRGGSGHGGGEAGRMGNVTSG